MEINNEIYPQIYISFATYYMKKANAALHYPILTIRTMEDLREVVGYYSNIRYLDTPIIIEDLSFFPRGGDNLLLKFIEDTKLKVIVLSTYDSVSPILLSRFRLVRKEYRGTLKSQFLSAKDGIAMIESSEEKLTEFQLNKEYAKVSPILYYYNNKIKNYQVRQRIANFL